ncbi:MAG: hypothetical protein JXD23_12385 [Spirochaetales bacterium]|nr:hypothetical protein [Spirochaetales bacterium]
MTKQFLRPSLRSLALAAAGALLWAALLSSCSLLLLNDNSGFSGRFDRTQRLLVLVDGGRAEVLAGALEQYRTDLTADGIAVTIESWTGGTAVDLRARLAEAHRTRNMDGALLVGGLPAAWYIRVGANGVEQFPCDLYLMDPDSSWADYNRDGMFESHSPLSLKYHVSRVSGSDSGLLRYFDKNHRFRSGTMAAPSDALVFKDDSWFDYRPGSSFGLSLIYPTVSRKESVSVTRRTDYASGLSGPGYEFVYQWIHSYPTALCVQEGSLYNTFTSRDIAAVNPQGLFYNLYNCSAARFTEQNLGMSYLTDTDWGLAVFGSTKVGGCYHPLVFNQVLSERGTWGDAFEIWYDYYGRTSDEWFLGMVILGDPALSVSTRGPIYRFVDYDLPADPDATEIRRLEGIDLDFTLGSPPGTFDDYRREHPEFFPGSP